MPLSTPLEKKFQQLVVAYIMRKNSAIEYIVSSLEHNIESDVCTIRGMSMEQSALQMPESSLMNMNMIVPQEDTATCQQLN